jgi:hypothetical protein
MKLKIKLINIVLISGFISMQAHSGDLINKDQLETLVSCLTTSNNPNFENPLNDNGIKNALSVGLNSLIVRGSFEKKACNELKNLDNRSLCLQNYSAKIVSNDYIDSVQLKCLEHVINSSGAMGTPVLGTSDALLTGTQAIKSGKNYGEYISQVCMKFVKPRSQGKCYEDYIDFLKVSNQSLEVDSRYCSQMSKWDIVLECYKNILAQHTELL